MVQYMEATLRKLRKELKDALSVKEELAEQKEALLESYSNLLTELDAMQASERVLGVPETLTWGYDVSGIQRVTVSVHGMGDLAGSNCELLRRVRKRRSPASRTRLVPVYAGEVHVFCTRPLPSLDLNWASSKRRLTLMPALAPFLCLSHHFFAACSKMLPGRSQNVNHSADRM